MAALTDHCNRHPTVIHITLHIISQPLEVLAYDFLNLFFISSPNPQFRALNRVTTSKPIYKLDPGGLRVMTEISLQIQVNIPDTS